MLLIALAASGLAAQEPAQTSPPAPPIHVGMSCKAAAAAQRDVQRGWPEGRAAPTVRLVCKNGKVTSFAMPGQPLALERGAVLPPMPVKPDGTPVLDFSRMPNLYSQPANCGPLADEITRRVRTATGPKPLKLYAVNRTVDGCAVPAPMGYRPDYLLPGAVDRPSQKAPPR